MPDCIEGDLILSLSTFYKFLNLHSTGNTLFELSFVVQEGEQEEGDHEDRAQGRGAGTLLEHRRGARPRQRLRRPDRQHLGSQQQKCCLIAQVSINNKHNLKN